VIGVKDAERAIGNGKLITGIGVFDIGLEPDGRAEDGFETWKA
jgi:hypothetical protein